MIIKKTRKHYLTRNIDTSFTDIFAMSNIGRKIHNRDFIMWIDDFGKNRNVGHNCMRYKFTRNEIEINVIVPFTDEKPFVDTARCSNQVVKKFGEIKSILWLLEEVKPALKLQWEQIIDTQDLIPIIKLVCKNHKNVYEALDIVLFDELYEDIYYQLEEISKASDFWNKEIKNICYFNGLSIIETNETIIDLAKSLTNQAKNYDMKTISVYYYNLCEDLKDYDRYKKYC